jgi:hypothetical protein
MNIATAKKYFQGLGIGRRRKRKKRMSSRKSRERRKRRRRKVQNIFY